MASRTRSPSPLWITLTLVAIVTLVTWLRPPQGRVVLEAPKPRGPPGEDRLLDHESVEKNGVKYTLRATICGRKYVPPGYMERQNEARRTFPDVIHIGQRKTGSTAVMRFLNLHPGVCVHRGSEVQFFMNSHLYKRGLEWYRSVMTPTLPGQLSLEKSVYFFKNHSAERIHAFNESIRLILGVRDPIARAISDFHFCERHGFCNFNRKLNRSFEEWAILPGSGEVNAELTSVDASLYANTMKTWLHYFDLNQFYILDGDDFLKDPVRELQNLETFLGLEHIIDESMFYYNVTRGCYCARAFGCVPDSGHIHPDHRPEVLDKLRTFFAPHNEEFFKQIGRRFDWSS